MLTQSPEITRIINEAKAEGKIEGKTEGTLIAMRQMLLELMEERFFENSNEVASEVTEITDVGRLRDLLLLVVKCADLDEFKSRAKLRS